jgi:hypothetical protein
MMRKYNKWFKSSAKLSNFLNGALRGKLVSGGEVIKEKSVDRQQLIQNILKLVPRLVII